MRRFLLTLGAILGFFTGVRIHQAHAETAPLETEGAETIYPLKFKDFQNRSITIHHRPQRIISLAPSITEIIFLLHQENTIIANTRFCTYPDKAKYYPKIGKLDTPSVELILNLKPDLILATTLTAPEVIHQLEHLGLKVAVFNPKDIASTVEDIKAIGLILDCNKAAREETQILSAAFAALKLKIQNQPLVRTLLLYGSNTLFSAGEKTFAGQMIAAAGGANIAANSSSDWPQLAQEMIIAKNPEVILIADEVDAPALAKDILVRWKKNPIWKNIDAVQSNRVFVFPASLVSVPGPRMAAGTELLFSLIHPTP